MARNPQNLRYGQRKQTFHLRFDRSFTKIDRENYIAEGAASVVGGALMPNHGLLEERVDESKTLGIKRRNTGIQRKAPNCNSSFGFGRMTVDAVSTESAGGETTSTNSLPDVYAFVGERLKELRVSNGLTQADVAAMLGVSPQQYQKYEDAQTKCRLDYLLRLARYYSVPVDTILPGLDDKPAKDEGVQELSSEADLLARLVSAFVRLNAFDEKLRFVQLVEAIIAAQNEK